MVAVGTPVVAVGTGCALEAAVAEGEVVQRGGVRQVLLPQVAVSQGKRGWSSPSGEIGRSRVLQPLLVVAQLAWGVAGLSPVPQAPQGWHAGVVPQGVALPSFPSSCSLLLLLSRVPHPPSPLPRPWGGHHQFHLLLEPLSPSGGHFPPPG